MLNVGAFYEAVFVKLLVRCFSARVWWLFFQFGKFLELSRNDLLSVPIKA